MDNTKKVAVIIPVYKPQLSVYERITLTQCLAVLAAYPIIMVKPQSLDVSAIINNTPILSQNFNDRYFESVHGYNDLLMSETFYKTFTDYEYILICQLDAFIFTDQLSYWCSQGFDYIGAPWLSLKQPKNKLDKTISKVKSYLYVRYNVKYADGLPKIGKQLENRVGNGGLSLRRVDRFLDYAVKYKPLIEHYIALKHPWFNEDIFWSIELNRKQKKLNIPPLKKALKFAFETNPQYALEMNKHYLPFGCHAWDKHLDFWRPIFKLYNYEI